MTEDQALKQWAPLVEKMARKFGKFWEVCGADFDDVRTEAMLGIVKAVRTYDPASGASLSTWVYTNVFNCVIEEGRRWEKQIGARRSLGIKGVPALSLEPDWVEDADAFAPVEARVSLLNLMEGAAVTDDQQNAVMAWLNGRQDNTTAQALHRAKMRIRKAYAA